MSIKILHVVPSLNCGGVEKSLLDLSSIWKHYDIGQFYIVAKFGSMSEEFKKNGAVVIEAPMNTKNPFYMIKNIFTLRKIIKKHNINLVHVHSRAPAWSVYFTKLVPFITTYHGMYKAFTPIKAFYNSIMLKGKYVIAVSKFIENHLKTLNPTAKIQLIEQGLDSNYFSKNNELFCKKLSNTDIKYPMILCPGRLSWTKGQDVLIKALKNLPEKLSIIFIGDGKQKYKSYLKSLAINCEQDIHFIPSVSDLRPWYFRAEIVVAPSVVEESFGRVCIESMLMEVPFIGTNIGATKEISNNKVFLCPPNHPKALSQKIFNILNFNKKDKNKCTSQAREYAYSNYSLDATMKNLKKVYLTLLNDI